MIARRSGIALLAAFALAGCGAETTRLQGYGEADYTYLASQESGVLEEVVSEGVEVEEGATLFRLSPDRLSLNASGAEASEAAARVRASGSAAEAVRAAQADAALAQSNYQRTLELFQRGFVSQAKLDSDRATRDAARAEWQRARDELNAARRETGAASAQTELARERLSDLEVAAPAAGRVERVYHRSGEFVSAGSPVVALLTPQHMKIRFFAPEPLLSRLRPGMRVGLSCDGCPDGLTARISFIADDPQFTPPVIYSEDERDKLVFLVEARPEQTGAIRPGLPVEIVLPEPDAGDE